MRGNTTSKVKPPVFSHGLQLQALDAAHPKGDRFFAAIAGLVSGNLCHEAVLVLDVAVRMGIKVFPAPAALHSE
jgi:hypothetical protein